MKVFDADILVPEEQTIIAGGKTFKIGKIPMRISIKIFKAQQASSEKSEVEALMGMADTVTDVLKIADPTITSDWVLDNVDMRQLSPLFAEVCAMMTRVAEKKPVQIQEAPTAPVSVSESCSPS